MSSRCLSSPRSRRSAGTSRRTSRGGRWCLEVLDERWCRPLAAPSWPPRSRTGSSSAWTPRQVPRVGAGGRGVPARAPADDRHAAARPAGRAALHAGVAAAGGPRSRARRPAALRHRRAGAGERGARRVLRSPPRGRAPAEAFSAAHLHAMAKTSRAPIKAFLLDQKRLAGVGNIYADEALFRARLHPLRPANRLTRPQAQALRDAVVASLDAGIAPRARDRRLPRPLRRRGTFQDRSSSTAARASRARAAGGRSASSAPPGAGRTSARAARRGRALRGGFGEIGQAAGLVGQHELLIAADGWSSMTTWGNVIMPVMRTTRCGPRVLREVDLVVRNAALVEQRLGDAAEPAGLCGVDRDPVQDSLNIAWAPA